MSDQFSVENEEKLLEKIKCLDPKIKPGIQVIGPVGAGKSSFINSCLSVGVGRKKALAKTGSDVSSYTMEFRTYKDNMLLKNFRIRDCMGIEPGFGKGFHPNDIFALMEGNVKKEYKFDNDRPITRENKFWNSNPSIEDKAQCVVFVFSAKTMYDGIPRGYKDKIEWLVEKTRGAGIPSVVVLTQADKLCSMVKDNPLSIGTSFRVESAVEETREIFNEEPIHVVVNYEDEFEITKNQNVPILLALYEILKSATEKVNK